MDSVKGVVLMLFAVFAVLLSILAMQGNLGTNWDEVGQDVASVILFIVVFAVVIGGVAIYRRG